MIERNGESDFGIVISFEMYLPKLIFVVGKDEGRERERERKVRISLQIYIFLGRLDLEGFAGSASGGSCVIIIAK